MRPLVCLAAPDKSEEKMLNKSKAQNVVWVVGLAVIWAALPAITARSVSEADRRADEPALQPAATATAVVESAPDAEPAASGSIRIESPMVGVFYRAPGPGAEPPPSWAARFSTNAWRNSSESPQRFNSKVKPCSKR